MKCQPFPSSGPLKSGVCYSFGPQPASWWTPQHTVFAVLAAGAVLVIVAIVWPGPFAWLWDQTLGRFGRDRMSRADAARWKSAASMADLGELVIAWLDGEIIQTPGHCGPPCDETIPLIPSLTILNRGGFVTDNSQLAEGSDDDAWTANVSGFAADGTLARIRQACDGTRLAVWACRGKVHECPRVFGHRLCGWRDMAGFWAERCPLAAGQIGDCWYVTVEDPELGDNDLLWPVLEKALGRDCTYASCHHTHEGDAP